MAKKITAARKAAIKKSKGTLAKACKALAPRNLGKQVLPKSLVPGSVLILVAGLHKGKRVVFLKQLESGLLLVTGPYKINGVPVRRINKAFAITTATKVALPAAVTDAIKDVDDKFFATLKSEAKKTFAAAKKAAYADKKKFIASVAKVSVPVNTKRVELQKKVDGALMPAVTAVGKEFLAYLGSRFTLYKGQYPHNLKF